MVANDPTTGSAKRYAHGMLLQAPVLEKVRRRLLGRRLLAAGMCFTIAALLAWAIARVLSSTTLPSRFHGLEAILPWAPWLAGAVAALLFWLALPPLTWKLVAATSDRSYGLKELLSTAVDVDPTASPVALALVRQAQAQASLLNPDRIVSLRPRTPLLALMVAAASCALAMAIVIEPGAPTVLTNTSIPSAEETVTAENVLRLADAVAQDALLRRDTYLEAVADALRDLVPSNTSPASQPQDGVTISALEPVLEHLISAYGSDLTVEDLAARLLDTTSAMTTSGEALADLQASTPPQGMETGPQGVEPTAQADRLDRLLESAMAEPIASEDAIAGGRFVMRGYEIIFLDGEAPRNVSQTTDTQPSQVGPAEIIGASEDSGVGDSQLAGAGTQDLFGGVEASPDLAPSIDPITVAGHERDEGRRIEVDLPPRPGWQEGLTSFQLGAWARSLEYPVHAEAVDPWYRAATGRYFEPSQETVGRRATAP